MNQLLVLLILAAIVVLVVGNYVSKRWRKWWYRKDINVPAPAIRRTDLLYGYYSCKGNQVAETKGHVNLLMESQFDGPDKCIQNILDAGVPAMVDVSFQVFAKELAGRVGMRTDAEQRLRDFFTLLASRGALQYVHYLYPIDEPNNTVTTADELAKAIHLVRRVATEFPALNGVRLAVIYAEDKPFDCQQLYDLIGYNDYDMKSSILYSKKFEAFLASLLPHQGIMLVPGGAYGQDPTPFINYAHTCPQVKVVMPFLWFDDATGSVGAGGIRSNGMAEAYRAAGRALV